MKIHAKPKVTKDSCQIQKHLEQSETWHQKTYAFHPSKTHRYFLAYSFPLKGDTTLRDPTKGPSLRCPHLALQVNQGCKETIKMPILKSTRGYRRSLPGSQLSIICFNIPGTQEHWELLQTTGLLGMGLAIEVGEQTSFLLRGHQVIEYPKRYTWVKATALPQIHPFLPQFLANS